MTVGQINRTQEELNNLEEKLVEELEKKRSKKLKIHMS